MIGHGKLSNTRAANKNVLCAPRRRQTAHALLQGKEKKKNF
jgi:hypothetical protein